MRLLLLTRAMEPSAEVLPALGLNYLGQAALVLSRPETIDNPFYKLDPPVALIPMVALATCATVIASQAVISGMFSLANQAIRLNYLPRLEIRHTSLTERGQIYVPYINSWIQPRSATALYDD